MEELGQSLGFVLYTTTVKGPVNGKLDLGKVRDYAVVTLNGKRIGTLDRRLNQHQIALNIPKGFHRLEILVENLARINFGRDMLGESKGLVSTPSLDGKKLTRWFMYTFPLERREEIQRELSQTSPIGGDAPDPKGTTFWLAQFNVADPTKDTYLDMSTWGKGVVWVNGHNLGRFWNIGPQQSLYLPAPWMKKGANDILVLSLDAPTSPVIAGLDKPVWGARVSTDQLLRKPGQTLKLDAKDIVKTARFAPGEAWETVNFDRPARGRYLAIEALNSHDGKGFAAIAELVFLDASGAEIPREECAAIYADSEELLAENGSGKLVLDNQPTTWWHTQWGGPDNPGFPHQIVIELGAVREVSGFRYQPRQGNGAGRIGDYRVYLRTEAFSGLGE